MTATRNMVKGEEITITHLEDGDSFRSRTDVWRFRCECALCKADRENDLRNRLLRKRLGGQARIFESQHPMENSMSSAERKAALAQARGIMQSIESLYNYGLHQGLLQAERVLPDAYIGKE